jgi:hypothetical protein
VKRTDSASGISGDPPSIRPSTRPTTRPRASATRKPAIPLKSRRTPPQAGRVGSCSSNSARLIADRFLRAGADDRPSRRQRNDRRPAQPRPHRSERASRRNGQPTLYVSPPQRAQCPCRSADRTHTGTRRRDRSARDPARAARRSGERLRKASPGAGVLSAAGWARRCALDPRRCAEGMPLLVLRPCVPPGDRTVIADALNEPATTAPTRAPVGGHFAGPHGLRPDEHVQHRSLMALPSEDTTSASRSLARALRQNGRKRDHPPAPRFSPAVCVKVHPHRQPGG